MYRVAVDWAPAYELGVSLWAYANRQHHKTLDMGSAWAAAALRRLSPELAVQLNTIENVYWGGLDILVRLCPGERDAESYLQWVASLSAGELYELLARYVPPDEPPLPSDLGARRDRHVALMIAWNEQYFRTVDPAVLAGLAAEADALRARIAGSDPVALVEQATGGVYLEPAPDLDLAVLVPQYHFRPWNLYNRARGMMLYQYPADVLPPAANEVPAGLLRLTRALSDENRLKILQFLAGGTRSFTDVVRFSGLAKSTVHHHMVALRAAGLVRVYDAGSGSDRYALRPGAVGELSIRLGVYLKGDA